MKKTVAFLLFLCMLLALGACSPTPSGDGEETGLPTTEVTEAPTAEKQTDDGEGEKDPSSNVIQSSTYFKIERVSGNKVRYEIYNTNGEVVLSGETTKQLEIAHLNSDILYYCIGKKTSNVRRFYDVKNDRFSEEYSNVVTVTEDIIVYLEGSYEERVLVAKSLFGDELRKEFHLGFSYATQPISSSVLSRGVLYLTYETGVEEPYITSTALSLYDAEYDYFTDYGTLYDLITDLKTVANYYNEEVDYVSLFGVTDEAEAETLRQLISSMVSLYSPVTSAGMSCWSYAKDLNGDGVFEIVFLREDYELIAIFTTVDGKPVLLDHFDSVRRGAIDHDGLIYAHQVNGANTSSREIYRIAADGASLTQIAEFGLDGSEWINDQTVQKYYKINNGQKISITKSEYDLLVKKYHEPGTSLTQYCARLEKDYSDSDVARQVSARNALLAVLEGRATVYNVESGEYCYLAECKVPGTQTVLSEAENLKYRLIRLTMGRVQELIIDCGDTKITLCYENGVICFYPYLLPNSSLSTPDGVYTLELPWAPKISFDQAWEIANAHWGNLEGTSTGATGKTLIYRVMMENSPEENIQYYHFVLMQENVGNETGELTSVSRVTHIWIDVMTGEIHTEPSDSILDPTWDCK